MGLRVTIIGAAILGLAWATQAGPGPVEPVPHPEGNASVEVQAADPVDLVESAPERRRTSSAMASTPDEPASTEVESDALGPPGTVSGLIFDSGGTPVGGGKVLFQRPGPAGKGLAWTAADKEGHYEILLEPGSWQVFAPADRSGGGPSMLCVGDVTVRSSQETLFDVASFGTLSLQGGVFRPDRENAVLVAELYLSYDPTRLIARAFCRTDTKLYSSYLAELEGSDELAADGNTVTRAPGLGCFRFEGLAPELYELRCYMDVERNYYATFPVDLTYGNKSFDPLPVSEAEFLSRAVFAGL